LRIRQLVRIRNQWRAEFASPPNLRLFPIRSSEK
jgi:hypothetical protein